MATPARKEFVDLLKSRLGDIPVSYDVGLGIWDNRVNAMLSYEDDADFHCVLQDDAIPCTDFYNEVKKVVVDKNKAYSLYFGNRKNMISTAKQADINGGIDMKWVSWGVAIVLPTRIIVDLIKYWEDRKELIRHDDTRIAKYLEKIGMITHYPMPSLVDHRHELKSLMESNEGIKIRKAYKFKG